MWGYPRPGGIPRPVTSISLRAAQLHSPEVSACWEGAESSASRLHPAPLPPHSPAKGLSPGRMARSPTPPSPDLCRVLPAKQRRAQAGAQHPGDSRSATFCFINFFFFFKAGVLIHQSITRRATLIWYPIVSPAATASNRRCQQREQNACEWENARVLGKGGTCSQRK